MCHSKTKDTSENFPGRYDETWFLDRMANTFRANVSKHDLSYEAYMFYHEDIDDTIIPLEHLSKLPEPLLLQTYMYTDEKQNEWIAGIVIDQETRELLYEIWLKNGKSIIYEMYID